MDPSKNNGSQENANGNNREDEQPEGRGNADLRDLLSLLGPPTPFFHQVRPNQELTPEERHRRTMIFIDAALIILNDALPSNRNSDFDSSGPRGGAKQ